MAVVDRMTRRPVLSDADEGAIDIPRLDLTIVTSNHAVGRDAEGDERDCTTPPIRVILTIIG